MDPNTDAAAAREVLAADDRRRAATMAGDLATLEAMMSEGFTYTHFNGFREGREAYLGRIRDGGAVEYIALDRRDGQVRVFGDVALVDGLASMAYRLLSETEPQTVHSLYLAVWRRAGGAWRIEAYASTQEGE
ncbi:nuclear transport factor 2 family protein [Phenylobacterium sp.]|jgi:ketosteroid isomerase-like protein|uniref:nuclear transport factor 2 family protein n=1 Tax=Phenylobacterium sp. TaxID=1871053 RepID=UPI002F42DE9B